MRKLVGITGNIASGKSWVLEYLSAKGYETLSSDDFIRGLYKKKSVQQKVLEILPEMEFFDKSKISRIIYQHKEKREKLEALLYPYLIEKIKSLAKEAESDTISFVEVPLLFEKGFDKLFDFIILVLSPLEVRLSRAKSRGLTEEAFYKISASQTRDEEKINLVDFIIQTSNGEIENQINKIIEEIRNA